MRPISTAILTLLTLFTCTALLTACANDAIPTAPAPTVPTTPSAPPVQPQPAAQTSAPPEPLRNRALIMRLTAPADVFPYPANGLHQPDRIGDLHRSDCRYMDALARRGGASPRG